MAVAIRGNMTQQKYIPLCDCVDHVSLYVALAYMSHVIYCVPHV